MALPCLSKMLTVRRVTSTTSPSSVEDEAAGDRQQRQLIGSDEVFPDAAADNQRAAGARSDNTLGSRLSITTVP